MRFKRHHKREPAELEITSFMNLMIILVPVLLVMMVFSRITVVDLKLPDLGDPSQQDLETQRVEVVLEATFIDVNRVFGNNVTRYNRITKKDNEYDFGTLSLTLQQLKREFRERGLEKRDALILSRPETDYQALITTIDTVRSYKAVVVTDVVDAELFPEIALGDAPIKANGRGL